MIDGGITRAAIILLGIEEMKNEDMIQVNGRTWFENGYKS